MPKKLDSIREKAIAQTREILQTRGYDALAMRDIAAACGVAVGTMYNYFPSKEYLTGCVVLEDWQQAYQAMTDFIGDAQTLTQGLERIYRQMSDFVASHQYLTAYDRRKAAGDYDFSGRHSLLCSQLQSILEQLQQRFSVPADRTILIFLAESILNLTVREYPYEQVAPAFAKLLN